MQQTAAHLAETKVGVRSPHSSMECLGPLGAIGVRARGLVRYGVMLQRFSVPSSLLPPASPGSHTSSADTVLMPLPVWVRKPVLCLESPPSFWRLAPILPTTLSRNFLAPLAASGALHAPLIPLSRGPSLKSLVSFPCSLCGKGLCLLYCLLLLIVTKLIPHICQCSRPQIQSSPGIISFILTSPSEIGTIIIF